jgi:hypothetical protein
MQHFSILRSLGALCGLCVRLNGGVWDIFAGFKLANLAADEFNIPPWLAE